MRHALLSLVAAEPTDKDSPCQETREIMRGLDEGLAAPDRLDQLVRAMVDAGIWGRLGRLSWARDAGEGLLLHWEPAA